MPHRVRFARPIRVHESITNVFTPAETASPLPRTARDPCPWRCAAAREGSRCRCSAAPAPPSAASVHRVDGEIVLKARQDGRPTAVIRRRSMHKQQWRPLPTPIDGDGRAVPRTYLLHCVFLPGPYPSTSTDIAAARRAPDNVGRISISDIPLLNLRPALSSSRRSTHRSQFTSRSVSGSFHTPFHGEDKKGKTRKNL